MGKTKFYPFVFLCFIVYAPLAAQNVAEKSSVFESSLDSSFFLIQRNSGFAFGSLGQSRKKFPPSFGAWFEFPIWNPSKNHLWKTSFLYENHRGLPREHSVLHQSYAGLQYSFFAGENSPSPSVFAGWEKSEKDLVVFGIHLEIPKRQSIQLFGKTGSDFKNVSAWFYSPLNDELRLFLGVSRTWSDARTEDRFTLGIGCSLENFFSSFFGNQTDLVGSADQARTGPMENFQNENSSLSWKFGFVEREPEHAQEPARLGEERKNGSSDQDDSQSYRSQRSGSNFRKDTSAFSPIARYAVVFLSVQELLSAGFPLSSALKISQESSRSREEYSVFINSLDEKNRSKILFLLRKKNPDLRKRGADPDRKRVRNSSRFSKSVR
ncbi:hypothetical protein [Leptospira barantonii]|uniref:hypothetical protein n=1 Tax=Leptospira barantonii TaxID=2023184 RepID=UPI001FCBA9D8|nr:hypothetical protein [Leptospira barantonii]